MGVPIFRPYFSIINDIRDIPENLEYLLSNKKVIIILGAGATVADVTSRSQIKKPPLDKHFFSIAIKAKHRELDGIKQYMKEVYDINIQSDEHDSLEKIMAH